MKKLLLTLLGVAAPRAALACPVCFGQNDSPMAIATNTGILAMLVVVVGVLGAFASFFIYLMRRAKLAEAQPVPADRLRTGYGGAPKLRATAEAGRRVSGQEGTAQC